MNLLVLSLFPGIGLGGSAVCEAAASAGLVRGWGVVLVRPLPPRAPAGDHALLIRSRRL